MEMMAYWRTRSRKKQKLMRFLARDFGLSSLPGGLSFGTLAEKDLRDFRKKASELLNSNSDTFLASTLCSKCAKCMLNNASVSRIRMNRFNKGFEVY
ncbi:MAG: hypothetical protein HYX24_02010 [Candidatus Aenigmarchaeota archaeon]|nr:hypothetical protein [Candidatus Aenigmarchaeota archaeon]